MINSVYQNLTGKIWAERYQLERYLGEGNLSALFLARSLSTRSEVFIKLRVRDYISDQEQLSFSARFNKIRRIQHDNLVTVYDHKAAETSCYAACEFLTGETLATKLARDGRISSTATVALLEPVAEVLDAAHALQIYNNLLHPGKIMICRPDNGEQLIKLLDLGGDSAPVGWKPFYDAPEKLTNSSVDGGADVYSLAAICYQMVAGRKPFGEKMRSITALYQECLTATATPLAEIFADVPTRFSAAVAGALAKNSGQRPSSCRAFMAELRYGLS